MAQALEPTNLTHHFLIAMPGVSDEPFARSVVYMCEHSKRGALGLVINKPSDISLKSLFDKVELPLERADLVESPVFFGGPVQTERGFVLHEQSSDADGGFNSSLKIPGGLEMTTSKDVLEALSSGTGPSRVFVSLGYSGWGAGQLEDEMSRNNWINVEAQAEIIFSTPIDQRYDKALSLLGIDPVMLSTDAGHA